MDFFRGHPDENAANGGRMRYNQCNRDAHGNLPGGQMNHTMQSRVISESIEDVEARRLQASMQARAYATFPRTMELNGVHLPLYKFKELEDLGSSTLKKRCLDFRDQIESTGCKFFENHLHLKLLAAQGEDKLLEWYINVQVTLASALNMGLDHAAFGAAHLEDTLQLPPARHNKQAPQQQQQQQQMTQEQYDHIMMMRQQQQQMQQMKMQMQENNFHNYSPPSHGQREMKPPPSRGMHDNSDPNASRFEDAARIRAKNNGGSNIFG